MGFCGDLRLFTQVLVEFWLQETRIRVVLHQAVHPFLGSCEAATGSLLYVLGNQTFGLKVYVDLFWSFFFYEVSIYFLCFWGQLLGWLGFFWSLHRPARIQYFLHRIQILKKPWMQQDHLGEGRKKVCRNCTECPNNPLCVFLELPLSWPHILLFARWKQFSWVYSNL